MDFLSKITKKKGLNKKEKNEVYQNNKNLSDLHPSEKKDLIEQARHHSKSMAGFQKDRMEEQRKMMWIAFGLAGVGVVAAGAMAVALAVITPLKETKPYIAQVDQVTGMVNVVSAVGGDKIKLSYQNLMDASNLANFVTERESYDWNSIQSGLDNVKLRSSNGVYEAMRRFIVDSDNSPLKILAKDKILKVGIISRPIVDSNKGVATVRFYKAVTDDSGKVINGYPVTYWQATITFDYEHKLTTENDIIENPLGFNVTSYRVDQETQN